MEVVRRSNRSDNGEKMLAVVPFFDHALLAVNVNVVFHIARVTGRQRLARDERPARTGSRTRGKRYQHTMIRTRLGKRVAFI